MTRSVRPVLNDILDAIDGIEHAARGKSIMDYNTDWVFRHAVQRGVEILSEASRRIPVQMRATRPDVPWSDILGIGNVLRHEYNHISPDII
jgi:uncharacterized protein with HEPN domain